MSLAKATIKMACLDGKPEVFHSLQGEGTHLGVPSIFLRSSMCNLHCQWCDTAYTWNWVNTPWQHQDKQKYQQKKWQITVPVQQLWQQVQAYACQHYVITGGEPLIQQKNWLYFVQLVKQQTNSYIELETNGTIQPAATLGQLVDQFNISLKLAHAGDSYTKRIQAHSIKWFLQHPRSYFKFVVNHPDNLQEIFALQNAFNMAAERIIIMPEGTTTAAVQNKSNWLADIAIKHNFRFSPRLHIQLWGDRKGV